MKNLDDFSNLIDLITTYNTEEKCSRYIAFKRWGENPVCPHCGQDEKVYKFSNGLYYKCGSCRKKFTVRVGTIFQDSKIPLTKWFAAIYLFSCRSKGISSLQLSKDLRITQKSAWHMLHRLRYGMAHPEYSKPLSGTVEMDETYVGGLEKNKHKHLRTGKQGRGSDKTPVVAMIERKGKVKTAVLDSVKAHSLTTLAFNGIEANSRVITDSFNAYWMLRAKFKHDTINHSEDEYVRGDVHTNTVESYFSLLKRNIYGIYHFASKKHLQKYLDEVAYRFNNRDISDSARFNQVLRQSNVGRLEYRTLIGKQ